MTSLRNIITASVVAGIFALHPSLNKGDNPITDLQHYVYGNSLNISTNNTINRNLLEIKWLCETNDTPCSDLIIYSKGFQINEIPSVKGNQKLIVSYKNKIIGEIPQSKTSKNQSHDYNINFSADKNTLFFKGEIIGPSPHQGAPVTIASL
ncbi:MAG: hypothetical protein P8Q14_06930 [Vicingaceae bacterium]|nr:hypothetical protein [Vicingaceae bacterium]